METAKPFLWGPVKNALLTEVRQEQGPELLEHLCHTTDQRVKEMLVQVLTELGQDAPERAETILRALFPLPQEPGQLQRVRQLVRPPQVNTEPSVHAARKIAIEVAGNLGIKWVLEAAARNPDPTLRSTAVRQMYHLWQRDPDTAFAILEKVAGQIMNGLIPDQAAMEAVFGLSLIIFFDHTSSKTADGETLWRLQAIWRGIIDRVFGLKGRGGRIGQIGRDFIRERVFSVLMDQCFKLLKEIPAYNLVNYEDLVAFFGLGAEEKALYRRLIRYLDVQGTYTKEELERDCLETLGIRSLLIEGVILMIFAAHLIKYQSTFLPFMRRFFIEAITESASNPYVIYVPMSLCTPLGRNPHDDEVFAMFVQTIEQIQQYYSLRPKVDGMNRVFLAPTGYFVDAVIYYGYLYSGTIPNSWLEQWLKQRIDPALNQSDLAFFDFFMKSVLPLVGIDGRLPRPALDTLALFFGHKESAIARELDSMIADFLARMRLVYPDEVEDFLEEHQASAELRLYVSTNEPVESIGSLLGGARALGFLVDSVVDSPPLRTIIMDVFDRAAAAKDLRAWLNYSFREVVNLVYGQRVV
jgi:hypothetical protein